jgi:hypothetical protein
MLVREVPVDLRRTGLSDIAPDLPDELTCGFKTLVGTLVLPAEFELELVAVGPDGGRYGMGSIVGRRARPTPSFQPDLQALMLTTTGRTGSVLMMRMLAAHPAVVVHPAGRYEVWPARYWAHMLAVLGGPADRTRSATPFGFDHDLWHAGQNPFATAAPRDGELGTWLAREHVDRLATLCLRNVEDWYAIAARDQGKAPAYFAEKNLLRTPLQGPGVADLYPEMRELFLVRDFRDTACSMLSFLGDAWRAEGFDTGRALRERIAPFVRDLASGWQARRDRAHLVRYEDLVTSPAEALTGVCEYLGIDASAATVDEIVRASIDEHSFTGHGTSATLAQSIGRWEREGDEAFRRALNDLFGEALELFGYVGEAGTPTD